MEFSHYNEYGVQGEDILKHANAKCIFVHFS
jgi:hypothetical protein